MHMSPSITSFIHLYDMTKNNLQVHIYEQFQLNKYDFIFSSNRRFIIIILL